MKRLLILLAALALVAAACGDDDASDTDAGSDTTAAADTTAPSGDKETITFVVNPWTASALNVQVAAQLVESQLGYPTEVITIDENEAMFTGLADGTLDAVLEIWPSGVTDSEQAFFDDGTVENLGGLGAIGKIGWFVPQYVLDERPEMANWEGLMTQDAADYFATADTGDKGRFLGTDPSYSQYDGLIIENLGMPFEVIFSGSEAATVAELDARSATGDPVLMYWWTPTAAVGKYSLVNVELPAFTPECGASGAAADADVACDYPEDEIFKAVSAMLKDKAPDVYTFLDNFTITNADQLEMLPPAEIDGEDVEDVAADWITAHEDTWKTWLP